MRRTLAAGRLALAVALPVLALVAPPVVAEPVTVGAAVDRSVVPLNQRVTLTVTVDGTSSAADPELPDLPQFTVFSAGSQRLMQSINLKTTTSTVFTYILVPKSKGTFTIPPVTVRHEGQALQTQPIEVQIVDEAATPPPDRAPDRQRSGVDDDAVRLEARVSSQSVYVGQQVTLTVRFFQDARLADQPQYEKPAITGFWAEDFPEPRTYYDHVDGRRYHVTELRTALFPTEAGRHTIGPARVDCRLRTDTDPFLTDPFSLFGRVRSVPKVLTTEPIDIEVLEIPRDGRPEAWDGAVGRFTLDAEIDKQTAEVGEAVTLTVALEGQGNLRLLGDPVIPDVEGMRSYQGEGGIEASLRGDRVGGRKAIRRVFIADAPGDYEIPAIHYATFDPEAQRFRSLTSKPLHVTITAASGGLATSATGPVGRQTLGGVAPDLRFIRLDQPHLRRRGGPLYRSAVFWSVQLVPLVLLATGLLFARHADRLRDDAAYARQRRSRGVARQRLRIAEHELHQNTDAFLGALSAAVLGYVADRANCSAAGLTQPQVEALLTERDIPSALVERVQRLLEQCDFGRFAPGVQDEVGRRKLLDEAASVLDALGGAGL